MGFGHVIRQKERKMDYRKKTRAKVGPTVSCKSQCKGTQEEPTLSTNLEGTKTTGTSKTRPDESIKQLTRS